MPFASLPRLCAALLCALLASSASAEVVFSQVYGAGGNSGAVLDRDYVELFNNGGAPQSLSGWSIQYSAANGSGWSSGKFLLPDVTLQPGQYYLVAMSAAGGNGAALPTPDAVASPAISMAAGSGKVLLAKTTDSQAGNCPSGAQIADLVAYGSTNCTAVAGTLSATLAAIRNDAGCAADFSTGAPAPRSALSPLNVCGGVDLPPDVAETVPASGATDVLVNGNVTITFTEAVGVTAGAFALDCPTGTSAAFTQPATSGTSFTLTPTAALPYDTVCTVTVFANQVADLDGTPDAMQNDYAFSFTTAPDVPMLSVAGVSQPEGNADNPMVFTVTLSDPAPVGGVSFDIATSPGTATAGEDYVHAAVTGATIAENGSSYAFSVTIKGDALAEPNETFTVTVSNVSGAVAVGGTALGTIENDDRYQVWQVQGSGACSPLISVPCTLTANTAKTTVDIAPAVVTVVGPDGFAMQSRPADSDNDPATSDGVWIYTFSTTVPRSDTGADIAVGDLVRVTGGVKEYFGLTEVEVTSTRNAGNSIVVLASGVDLPPPVAFGDGTGIPSTNPANLSCPGSGPGGTNNEHTNFECFEGMLVSIPEGITTTGKDRFGDLAIGPYGRRAYREQGVKFPDAPVAGASAAGTWDGNPEFLEMKPGRLGAVDAGIDIVGGVRFSGVGIISFDFGDYQFWPAGGERPAGTPRFALVEQDNVLPRPVRDHAPTELRIGSFNAWRLCDTIQDHLPPGGPIQFECDEGIEAGGAAAYALKLEKVSAYIVQVLKSPDVLGMQEVEKLVVLQDLAARIVSDGGPQYQAFLVEGNDPGGIDVGYLVRTDTIDGAQVTQLRGDQQWNDPSDGLTTLHDRPPLLLRAQFTASAGGEPFRFAVLNSHNRSFGANHRVYAKRFLQARAVAEEVQAYQTDPLNADRPLVVIGDYNAYQFSDGFTDPVGLIAGDYRNDENECSPANGVTSCNLPETGGVTQQVVDPALTVYARVQPGIDPDQVYSYTFTERFGAIFGHTASSWGDNGREVAANQVIDQLMLTEAALPRLVDVQFGRANVDASFDGHANGTGPGGAHAAIGSSDHDGFVVFFDAEASAAIFADGFEGD